MYLVKLVFEEYILSKIVCVGCNYVEYIVELNNEIFISMVLFVKFNSVIL